MRRYNRRQLRSVFPASDMTHWRAEQLRGFPKHIKIDGRNFWDADAVDKWLVDRAKAGEAQATDVDVAAACISSAIHTDTSKLTGSDFANNNSAGNARARECGEAQATDDVDAAATACVGTPT